MWAKMRAALSDYYTLDKSTTALTRFTLLVINSHMIVVVASFSPKVAILAERCSAVLDAEGQYGDYAFV